MQSDNIVFGSHDGTGAGDHDLPYKFGRPINANTANAHGLSTHEYARLLIFKGRLDWQHGEFATNPREQAQA